MKLGIFAKTFDGATPMAVLSAARETGYQAVQYNMACSGIGALPLSVDEGVAAAVAEASAGTGIEIAAVSATYNMIHPDMAKRALGRRSFAAIAAAARPMGTRLLTVCTGSRDALDQWRHHPENATPGAWRELVDEFAQLLEIAETHDIDIGVEPEFNNVISTAERARQLIDTLGSERVRIVFDPANLAETAGAEERKRIIEVAVDLLQDRLTLAHAKDRRADGRAATVGHGVIDFEHYVGVLQKAGFNGVLVTHGLAAQDAPAVAALLKSLTGLSALENESLRL